jgi:hypothetical protein
MASNIIELFGYSPQDRSVAAVEARQNKRCPFLGRQCVKTLNDGEISGACTLKARKGGPVICCPIRLYANKYEILRDVARVAFGPVIPLLAANAITKQSAECVAVFGKGWGKELRLPNRGKSGGYFVDWVLAHISSTGELINFVCPTPVYNKISERLGGGLRPYPIQPGALTIMWYDIGPPVIPGDTRSLLIGGQFTTTVDQIALAFTAPSNLPPAQVYENAIRASLRQP